MLSITFKRTFSAAIIAATLFAVASAGASEPADMITVAATR